MIDVHCHLEFMENPEQVVKEARSRMEAIVTSIADPKHFDRIMTISEKNKDFVFVTAGLHPTRVSAGYENYLDIIRNNAEKICGIGETGLDYHHAHENKEKTKEVFTAFISLANELDKPLVVHCRDGESSAFQECLEFLKNAQTAVVLHCFSGSKEVLAECLDRGYWISFATIICKSKSYRKLAKNTPLEAMLLETDSPWLDPESPELINRPWKIEKSAEVLAKMHSMEKEEILKITAKNAKNVFNI